jgi:hypothetical protein
LCWLHSVGQNHLYVMLLLSQGCCFIQSLHFSYELQEDSVQNSNQSVQFPCIRPDDVVFRPDALQSATFVQMTRTFRSNAHLCLETLNYSRFHLFRRNGKSSGCSLEFEKIPMNPSRWCGYTVRTPFSVWQALEFLLQDTVMGRRLQPSGRCVIPSGRCPP